MKHICIVMYYMYICVLLYLLIDFEFELLNQNKLYYISDVQQA